MLFCEKTFVVLAHVLVLYDLFVICCFSRHGRREGGWIAGAVDHLRSPSGAVCNSLTRAWDGRLAGMGDTSEVLPLPSAIRSLGGGGGRKGIGYIYIYRERGGGRWTASADVGADASRGRVR
jgi:hypothetical protein